jgi:chitinase
LSHVCRHTSADIIPIGFLNVFPEQGAGGWPGSNFGSACGTAVYTNAAGVKTQLQSGCSQIEEDIAICQKLGRKVLLSLGGEKPKTQKISDRRSAEAFAEFIWAAFGPKSASYSGPRPFGNAVVDGFDFDIEHNGSNGYAEMANRLRELYKTDPSRTYYTSAAPQCVVPDAQLGDAIQRSFFDFIWVQFYNTKGCSARDFISRTGHFTFDDFVKVVQSSPNPKAKIFIGLPADEKSANPSFYLNLEEVRHVASHFQRKHPQNFGGLMFWEASASLANNVDGKSFADACKNVLFGGRGAHSSASGTVNATPVPDPTGTGKPTDTHVPTYMPTGVPTTPTSVLTGASTDISTDATTGVAYPTTSIYHSSSWGSPATDVWSPSGFTTIVTGKAKTHCKFPNATISQNYPSCFHSPSVFCFFCSDLCC